MRNSGEALTNVAIHALLRELFRQLTLYFFLLADSQYHKQEGEGNQHPYDKYGRTLFTEHVIISFQVNDDNNPGEYIGHITADKLRKF